MQHPLHRSKPQYRPQLDRQPQRFLNVGLLLVIEALQPQKGLSALIGS